MLENNIRQIDPQWTGNDLLAQTGTFMLTDACELIPFKQEHILAQVLENPRAKDDFGVWRDEQTKRWLVDMGLFKVWIISVWNAGNREGTGVAGE